MQKRQIGKTEIWVTPVAMGCWPISGMTSLDVNDSDSVATLLAALDSGINFFDTAYCYGADGQSERLIARALGQHRDEIVIATKGGIHWAGDGSRIIDGSPATLRCECETSLRRLGTDHVDILYLHAPDPRVPLTESAAALKSLLAEGKTISIGVSNFSLEQLQQFHRVCPISVIQPPYNMLQRGIESDVVPWCQTNDVSVVAYWPLLKGLLAGKLKRDHVFQPGDGRAKYPMFQGQQWQRNQDLVDDLRSIAAAAGVTVTQLVVAWTIRQPGITSALCGAKRAIQIGESASGGQWDPSKDVLCQIDEALERRGDAESISAVER